MVTHLKELVAADAHGVNALLVLLVAVPVNQYRVGEPSPTIITRKHWLLRRVADLREVGASEDRLSLFYVNYIFGVHVFYTYYIMDI